MLELVLARHGQSYGNLDYSLGPDTDLTDLGRQQAGLLGEWLADQGYRFDAVYSSPLRRARQTAQIVNAHFQLAITFDPDLREAEFWLPGTLPVRQTPLGPNPSPPFEPAYAKMHQSVMRAAARILDRHPEGRVLVVAHGGSLGTLVRGILRAHGLLLHTDLTAIHCLSWQDGLWNLEFTNRRDHLVGLEPDQT